MGDWKNWVCVFLLSAPIYPEISSFLHAFPVRKNEEKEGIREEKVWKNHEICNFRPIYFRRKIMSSSKFWARSSRARRDLGACEEKIEKFTQKLQFWDARKSRFFHAFSNKEHLLGLVLVHMSSSGIFVFWYVSSVQNCARVQSFSWRHPVRGCGKWENVVSFLILSSLDGGSAGVLVIPGMARVARKFWTSCFSWKVPPSVVLT